MSDAEIDPLQINVSEKPPEDNDKQNHSDDDYLNSVKEFLTLSSSASDLSDNTDRNCSPQESSTVYPVEKTQILRRSSRMSKSLYKDYSHVTTFKALPSIKLTLNLRNLPKGKSNGNSTERTKKPKKSKTSDKVKSPISTQELQQILEGAVESAEVKQTSETPTQQADNDTKTRLTKTNEDKGSRQRILSEQSTKSKCKVMKNEEHKRKVLPKASKKIRVQTETSKKFQKLKKAYRRQFRLRDSATSRKITTVAIGKESKSSDQPTTSILDSSNKENPSVTEFSNAKNTNKQEFVIRDNIEISSDGQLETVDYENADVPCINIVDENVKLPLSANNLKKNSSGKHNLPIIVLERHTSIAEPNRSLTKVCNSETKTTGSLQDCKSLEYQEKDGMIYVKSPEVLNATSLPKSSTSPSKSTEEIKSVGTEEHSLTLKNVDHDEKAGQDENSAAIKRKIILERTVLSHPGYKSSPRRNTISTTDLFSRPSMALKRAISTGILHKISPTILKPLRFKATSVQKENVKQHNEIQNKNEDDGPPPKRLRENTPLPESASLPVCPHPRYALPPRTFSITPPKNPSYKTCSSTKQLQSLSEDIYNITRMHYERLAHFSAVHQGNEQLQTLTSGSFHNLKNNSRYSIQTNTENPIFRINNDTTCVSTSAKDKQHSEVNVTQCHPLNESKTSTIPTYQYVQLSPNGVGNISNNVATNKCKEHTINEIIKVPSRDKNSQVQTSNATTTSSTHFEMTSPLTISDSSSSEDTDIELEVDVVGNDSVNHKKTPTYSRILIKHKSDKTVNEDKISSPKVPKNPAKSLSDSNFSNNFVEEIRKLRSVVELLLERAGTQCSEKDLQQIRQMICKTTAPPTLTTTSLPNAVKKKSKESNSRTVTNQSNMTTLTLPKITNVVSLCEDKDNHSKSPLIQQVENVIHIPLNEAERNIAPNKSGNVQLHSSFNVQEKPKAVNQHMYHNGYKSVPLANSHKEQAAAYYGTNQYALFKNRQNDEQTGCSHTSNPEYPDFRKQLYQDAYLKRFVPLHQPQTHFSPKVPNYKQAIKTPTTQLEIKSVLDKILVQSTAPSSMYATNYKPTIATTKNSNFHQPIIPPNYEHIHFAKELNRRSVSSEEPIARSPDSGYISPSRKVSPHLDRNSELSALLNRHNKSVFDLVDITKQPLNIIPPKIIHSLHIPDPQTMEQITTKLLPKLHPCGTLNPEQYVKEMYTLEREQCPPFLLQFYSYVTKKQIASNQLPISFKIFLEFKSAGKLKMFENSFAVYLKKREEEQYLKSR